MEPIILQCGPALSTEELLDEQWQRLWIAGLSAYEVSDMGRLRGPRCRLTFNRGGYPTVELSAGDRVVAVRLVCFVLWHFVGIAGDGYRVKYLDGNPQNVRAVNLAFESRPKPSGKRRGRPKKREV